MEYRRKKRPRENAKDLWPVRNAARIHGKSNTRQGRSSLVSMITMISFNRDDYPFLLSSRATNVFIFQTSYKTLKKGKKDERSERNVGKSNSEIIECIKVNATTRPDLDSSTLARSVEISRVILKAAL